MGNRNANFGQMKEFASQSKANRQQILPKSSRIKYTGKLDCLLSKLVGRFKIRMQLTSTAEISHLPQRLVSPCC